jgi:hypothetical protein
LNKRMEELTQIAQNCKGFLNQNWPLYVDQKMQIYSDLIKHLKDSGGNFIIDKNIWEYFYQFNDWVNSLGLEKGLLFLNLSGIIFIMLGMVSIIMIFYGNFFINYFQLEKRYPKLAKLINLRLKLQQFYLLSNIFLISVVLIIMFVFNLIVFIYN